MRRISILKSPKNDPATLQSELVAAREQYNATKNSVLDRAQTRYATVTDTIADLRAEQEALANVAQDAQS